MAWDVSFFSTVALEGVEGSLGNVLVGLGWGGDKGKGGVVDRKSADGKRVRLFWATERESGAVCRWKIRVQGDASTEQYIPGRGTDKRAR